MQRHCTIFGAWAHTIAILLTVLGLSTLSINCGIDDQRRGTERDLAKSDDDADLPTYISSHYNLGTSLAPAKLVEYTLPDCSPQNISDADKTDDDKTYDTIRDKKENFWSWYTYGNNLTHKYRKLVTAYRGYQAVKDIIRLNWISRLQPNESATEFISRFREHFTDASPEAFVDINDQANLKGNALVLLDHTYRKAALLATNANNGTISDLGTRCTRQNTMAQLQSEINALEVDNQALQTDLNEAVKALEIHNFPLGDDGKHTRPDSTQGEPVGSNEPDEGPQLESNVATAEEALRKSAISSGFLQGLNIAVGEFIAGFGSGTHQMEALSFEIDGIPTNVRDHVKARLDADSTLADDLATIVAGKTIDIGEHAFQFCDNNDLSNIAALQTGEATNLLHMVEGLTADGPENAFFIDQFLTTDLAVEQHKEYYVTSFRNRTDFLVDAGEDWNQDNHLNDYELGFCGLAHKVDAHETRREFFEDYIEPAGDIIVGITTALFASPAAAPIVDAGLLAKTLALRVARLRHGNAMLAALREHNEHQNLSLDDIRSSNAYDDYRVVIDRIDRNKELMASDVIGFAVGWLIGKSLPGAWRIFSTALEQGLAIIQNGKYYLYNPISKKFKMVVDFGLNSGQFQAISDKLRSTTDNYSLVSALNTLLSRNGESAIGEAKIIVDDIIERMQSILFGKRVARASDCGGVIAAGMTTSPMSTDCGSRVPIAFLEATVKQMKDKMVIRTLGEYIPNEPFDSAGPLAGRLKTLYGNMLISGTSNDTFGKLVDFANATVENAGHLLNLEAMVTSTELRAILRPIASSLGLSLNETVASLNLSVLLSDLGKLEEFKALFVTDTPLSDLLLWTLMGERHTINNFIINADPVSRSTDKLVDALYGVDGVGGVLSDFGGKPLLPKNLTIDGKSITMTPGKWREVFRQADDFPGWAHDLPGLAVLLLIENNIPVDRLKHIIGGVLFHNGPTAMNNGKPVFWTILTEVITGKKIIKGIRDIHENPVTASLKDFFVGSVYEGADGKLGYPMPKHPLGIVHAFLDRLEQGVNGTVKLTDEIMAGKHPVTNLTTKVIDQLVSNPGNTIAQVNTLFTSLPPTIQGQLEVFKDAIVAEIGAFDEYILAQRALPGTPLKDYATDANATPVGFSERLNQVLPATQAAFRDELKQWFGNWRIGADPEFRTSSDIGGPNVVGSFLKSLRPDPINPNDPGVTNIRVPFIVE